jgi:hypothetical protein
MSASWTVEDVKKIAPEFASLPSATFEYYISLADLFVNARELGSRAIFAGSLMTAHLMTLFPAVPSTASSKPAGPISQMTSDGVSVTYAVTPVDLSRVDASLGQSSYGLTFSSIVRKTCLGPRVL